MKALVKAKDLLKDKVLFALLLTLGVVGVMALTSAERYNSQQYAPDPNIAGERWGCPAGQVEFQDGCYDSKTKTYTQGKHRVSYRV